MRHLPPQSAPTWTHNLGAPVSFPLVANGMVFVATANTDGSYGNELYALDAQTGAVVWGPVAVSGTYFGSGLTYENGRVFLLMLTRSPCLQCVERRSALDCAAAGLLV